MVRLRKKHYFDYEWKNNPNAVYVGRPTKWGNPFKVEFWGLEKCLEKYEEWLKARLEENPEFLEPLRGKDLVCFCPLDQPCHADIIEKFLSRDNKTDVWCEDCQKILTQNELNAHIDYDSKYYRHSKERMRKVNKEDCCNKGDKDA